MKREVSQFVFASQFQILADSAEPTGLSPTSWDAPKVSRTVLEGIAAAARLESTCFSSVFSIDVVLFVLSPPY